jgi:hypothetical protein
MGCQLIIKSMENELAITVLEEKLLALLSAC